MIKRIIASFNCLLVDEEAFHNVIEFNILETNEVYYRSNDSDGQTRYYTEFRSSFENKFKVNIAEYITLEETQRFFL